MNLSKAEKKTQNRLVVATILLLVMMIVYGAALFSILKLKHKSLEDAAKLEAELAAFINVEAQGRILANEQQKINALDAYIISEDTSVQVFELLELYANQARVQLDIISANTNGTLDIEVEATGSKDQIENFLLLIENTELYLETDRIVISRVMRNNPIVPVLIEGEREDVLPQPQERWETIISLKIKSFVE